ncbi:MAG: hypothetical protein ACOYMF_05875 [Bacteroidales bacterium]
MKRTLRLSSVIALLALISLIAQAFYLTKTGFHVNAPVIGIVGIAIVLILAFAFSHEDNKSDDQQEQD